MMHYEESTGPSYNDFPCSPQGLMPNSTCNTFPAGSIPKSRFSTLCSNCGSLTLPHRMCESCGVYKGNEIIQLKNEDENTEETEA